ncbi:LysR family transcriptional regulator [Antrihabitans cavernicola]|uniref:LysR family transcriptional regulator n=1 Tax=Antrihabitans cavernicola TaxID=2495913 RepID=A0A5A7SFX7_9NOCA|nr:LysR family transcriptional regulator [Spelaeibacter cavernicola]KAA0024102.1 LysR family transcriptional regulator [Spelaeibacter cavernicola]
MELSLHRLKLLRELRRRGTVTAAAQSLSYTVSAVSQQLTLLERDAGTPLFEKLGRRMVLTEAGVVLAEHAEEILASVERAGVAMEAAQGGVSARLTAGVWASVAAGLLPTALTALSEAHPGIELRTKELAPEDTADAVRDGALDLSFVIEYSNTPLEWDPALNRQIVAVERMHVALPPGSELGDVVALADLADRQWILAGPRSQFGRAVRRACHHAGFDPKIGHEVEEQATALAMVVSGLGVTLVSDLGLRLLPPGSYIVELADDFHRTVWVAYRASSEPRASLQLVIGAVAGAARQLGLAADPSM